MTLEKAEKTDVKEAWVRIDIEFVDYEFRPDKEIRDGILNDVHELASQHNIDDLRNEYVEGSVSHDGLANIHSWHFEGRLEDVAEFLKGMAELTIN